VSLVSEYEKIKSYWLAPIFKEFPYNEQRDHNNDIAWLIEQIDSKEKALTDIKELTYGKYFSYLPVGFTKKVIDIVNGVTKNE
jgi:hypothetical protein